MMLTEFLLARIADDEASAPFVFAEQFTPARVLAECEAKRLIMEIASPAEIDGNWEPSGGVPDILRALALPYADHPDYDESWRP